MKNRHSARAHRQLVPTDARSAGGVSGGAFALQVITEGSARSAEPSFPGENAVPLWIKRRVLLLNVTYEPLTALPARRAVVLMTCGKADTVHEDPQAPVVHSEQCPCRCRP